MQDHFWYEPLKPATPKKGAKAKEAKPGPRFRIRMGSLIERAEFDAELDGRHSASPVAPFVMLETAVAGVRALLSEADGAEAEELLRSFHGDSGDPDAPEVSAKDRQRVTMIQEILEERWPDYGRLVRRNARYRQLSPLLALQRWVDGWEDVTGTDGKPLEYERDDSGQIPDGVLRRLAPALIFAVGNSAHNFQYATGEEKN